MRKLAWMLFGLVLVTILATWQLFTSWGNIDLRDVPLPPLAGEVCDAGSESCSSTF